MASHPYTGDPARLRDLAADSRTADLIAYLAMTNDKGEILLADQISLIGSAVPFATTAHVLDDTWRAAPVWVVVAPLRNNQTNEIVGNLRLGLKTDTMEQFLAESRTIFTFTGIIAVLVGVLLAQVLGGAVAAPIESLAAQTRRVASGDFSAQFSAAGNDEIAQLGAAFNAMVRGLQEREKLRDLFGKFVSPQVREAIERGRVTLRGELPLPAALPILAAIAHALDYAHAQGFVYRDIKPSNVMLETQPNAPLRPVLTDFGIAKILGGQTRMTNTGGMLGTFDYIAPEQIQGAAEVDGRADVYALGVMAYQMLTGELPFRHSNPGALLIAHLTQPAPDPREAQPDVPPAVAHALQQALAKTPAKRFATAGAFVAALAET